ncbi:SpoIVB peptidase S55 domain-containing protein [Sandaracinus amylolyticus]|uniref:SpoIVB peptidase S55 domain-containing protein n=1 Tax=Sandaracinus amylolyticus TaxID=927083 RepID=UPI0012EDB962|nr:SpoIVB peptidase S55 domain-containing protein [Sandaracinus amylolyticus]
MRRALTVLFTALALVCAATVLSDAPIAIGQLRGAGAAIMEVSEVRPGMRGYGLTVFRGTQPERFEVEVIDVLHDFRPDQDLILVRTIHPILEEAPTVGGMSGSPIYLEDRLVGAYAYGWPYGRQPVAGVTPIRSMLAEIDRPVRPDSFPGAVPMPATSGARPARRPELRGARPYLGTEPRGALAALEEQSRRLAIPRTAGTSGASMIPASTPLLVGGLEPSVVAMLSEHLAPFGLDVLQAGGGGARAATTSGPPARFVDGGGLAVTLARGDIASNVVGTVTHVQGDRLVAFGHPMLEAGETGLPTAVARVLHILASFQRSFKIAEPVAPVGALVQDRQATIVVDQQLQPAMIPVRLRLTGVPDAQRSEWNFEVASHRALTPLLVFTSITNAVKSVAADHADVMFDATSRVWIDGRGAPVEVHDTGFAATGPASSSALQQLRGFDLVELAFVNPFVVTRPTRIEIELAMRFAHETAEIVDASVASTEVDPGERVNVRVVLRRYGMPEEVRMVPVDVPESAAGQSISVMVQPGSEVELERPEPRTLDHAIDAVRERYPRTSLVVSTRLPGSRGLRMAGHVVRSLPGSALDALQQAGDSDRARAFVTHRRAEVPMDVVLSGGARVELSVRRVARAAD